MVDIVLGPPHNGSGRYAQFAVGATCLCKPLVEVILTVRLSISHVTLYSKANIAVGAHQTSCQCICYIRTGRVGWNTYRKWTERERDVSKQREVWEYGLTWVPARVSFIILTELENESIEYYAFTSTASRERVCGREYDNCNEFGGLRVMTRVVCNDTGRAVVLIVGAEREREKETCSEVIKHVPAVSMSTPSVSTTPRRVH